MSQIHWELSHWAPKRNTSDTIFFFKCQDSLYLKRGILYGWILLIKKDFDNYLFQFKIDCVLEFKKFYSDITSKFEPILLFFYFIILFYIFRIFLFWYFLDFLCFFVHVGGASIFRFQLSFHHMMCLKLHRYRLKWFQTGDLFSFPFLFHTL